MLLHEANPDFTKCEVRIFDFIGYAFAVLLALGIGMFNLGADLAMTPMGTQVGSGLSRQKNLLLLLSVCFVLGMLITIAEPDLQVLAGQVSAVMNATLLIYTVGIGVGAFLVISVLKIVFKQSLSHILMLFYMLLFVLALLLVVSGNEPLLPMAFDSGGVTTGPITVPFIMALGVGISAVLSDRRSKENSFGLVALCSVGPILAVLVLGIFSSSDLGYAIPDYTVSSNVAGAFLHTAAHTSKEVTIALGLIVAFFLVCQVFFLKLNRRQLLRIALGVLFTYVAWEQGVRGGTILNARGVVNEDAAAFFGITLHADKEILMMVVEKNIRDQVLNAIYKEMGMSKKAKGIAFSLPVSDVAGLAPKELPKDESEA